MESLGKDHAYSDSSLPPSAAREEYAVPDVIITHRLRDRELLRKRKAEAQEKDSIQWVLREQEKNKRQRRGRGARRGRGHQLAVEPSPEPEPEPDPQLDPQEEAEPAPSKLALPEPLHQEQPPVLVCTLPPPPVRLQEAAVRSWAGGLQKCSFCWDDWVAVTARGLAKRPRGRRESPPPHAQLFTPVKSPGREQEKNKRQRRGRGARRGRGHQLAVEPSPEPEPEPDPQLDPQEEAEPAPSKLALPEPLHQEQPPVLTMQDLVSGMQPGVAEGELAARSQDPAGEEEVLKPAEAELPEALNTPLENDHQDNEYSTHVLF
ncbi:PREDICTED: hemogen [Aptenodytes forsteri]|uniref:hemogen n=1 Tax=Aptenodytes forsteri TaxID=9233 RepID=UPI0004F45574|nr:PREDICTED: hemogen [Aptenodytes forsteri]